MHIDKCAKQKKKKHACNHLKGLLQEPGLLKQSRHLLVLPLPRLPLQTERPEVLTRSLCILELTKGFFDVSLDRGNGLEIERLLLPSLNVADDFRGLLPLLEVDKVAWKGVGVSIVYELQSGQKNT